MTFGRHQLGPRWSMAEGGKFCIILHATFFAPLLVSSFENPTNNFEIHVTNDLQRAVAGKVVGTVFSFSGVPLYTFSVNYSIAALGSAAVFKAATTDLFKNGATRTNSFLSITADESSSSLTSKNVYYFSPLKGVYPPLATVKVNSITKTAATKADLVLQTNFPAHYVWLETSLKGVFSDNAFLLTNGTQTVIAFNGASDFTVESLQSTLKIKSISDTL